MARVRCVMMQRDESTLLESWFKYYGYLFGFENLLVFDNGSVDTSVIDTLRRYESVGATILWNYKTANDFEGKGFHFDNIIRSWDNDLDYDFAIPLDCDEFLALFTEQGLSCERSTIHAYLDGLKGTQQVIGLEWSLFNVPGRPGWFRPELYKKGFFPARTIEFLDHGFHEPRSRLAAGRRETHLTYVHLHNKSHRMTLEHAARKLEGRVDTTDKKALRKYSGPGAHLVNHFLITEEEYLRKYDQVPTIWFGSFVRLLMALDSHWPELTACDPHHELEFNDGTVLRLGDDGAGERGIETIFNSRQYTNLNPDILSSTSTPLMHYLRFGHGEGRRISPRSLRNSRSTRPALPEAASVPQPTPSPEPTLSETPAKAATRATTSSRRRKA